MNTFIDIETIPKQGAYDCYLEDAKNNFKAPALLTKTQACADLGLTGNDAKYISKDDAIAQWEAKFAEDKAPEVAEEAWRRTALNGAQGEIVTIAWACEDDEVQSVQRHASTVNGELILSDEADLLRSFFSLLNKRLSKRNPYFIGQFIGGFDLPFIFHRAVILRVPPPFDLPFNGRHGSTFYDTQIAWAGYKGRMSQDSLCAALGIAGKPDDIDGSKVWDFVKAGNIDRVAEYNRDDVFKNREIYKRLNFVETVNPLSKLAKSA